LSIKFVPGLWSSFPLIKASKSINLQEASGASQLEEEPHFIGKEFQSKNFLAMKFTARMLYINHKDHAV
jgi:hypothetical protein